MIKKENQPSVGFAIEGHIQVEARDADTNEVLVCHDKDNLVVNTGLDRIMRLISGADTNAIGYGVAGTTATASASNTTSMGIDNAAQFKVDAAVARTGASNESTAIAEYNWSYATNELTAAAQSAVSEVGLCVTNETDFANNTLVARAAHGTINKDTTMTLSYTYTLKFQRTS